MNTEQIAQQFETDGFVVVPGIFSTEDIARIEQNLQEYIREVVPTLSAGNVYYEQSPAKPIKSMFRMHERLEFFRGLMRDPRLLNMLRAIWPEGEIIAEGVMFFGKPAGDGTEAPAHQDNSFQCWEPPLALTLTIAIDESTPENGVLICQKGSQQVGLLPHRQSGVAGFSRCLVDAVDADQYPEVQLRMKTGDVSLHHINTVHRSGPNRTSRPRRQLGIGYRSSLAARNEVAFEQYQKQLKELHQRV